MDLFTHHSPAYSTSLNALALICQVGIEPHVIE